MGSSIRLSICLSVCPKFHPSYRVQYLKFRWSYSYQTWTVSSSMGSSHFTAETLLQDPCSMHLVTLTLTEFKVKVSKICPRPFYLKY